MANNLMRFDPFGDLTRFDPFRTMDDMLRDMRPGWALRDMPSQPAMRLDVTETDQAYDVKAEIPGVKKEDIKVDVVGNRVSIVAECKQESEEKDKGTVVRSERYYGQQSRVFTLESDIDDSKAEAKYEDGVLHLILPKKAGTTSRKLPIH